MSVPETAKKDIKLIALDLDGTLLNSEKVITPRTIAALQAAMRKGVRVTIATGRMLLGAAFFGRQFGANAPIICCNGGVVQGMDDPDPLFVRHMAPETVRSILSICHAHGWYANWYIGREVYVERYLPEYFYVYRTVEDFHVREVGDRFLDYTDDVIQCVVRDLDGNVEPKVHVLREALPGAFSAQQNTGRSSDITPVGVTKALGLEFLMHHYGLAPENVMACGDADNDLPMLHFAGTAVVPANGLDCAKALATYHAESNDEDGIAKAIEELVL